MTSEQLFELGPHQSLIETSTPWVFGLDQDAERLEQEMIKFMNSNHGVGLAANQIGITKRVFVMGNENIPGFPAPFAVFNPEVLESSEETTLDQEGCLSYPGLFLNIKRPSWIRASYQDSKGNTHEVEMNGYLARCFQHELDHLNGVCFIDIVSPMKLQLAMKKLRKNSK